MLGAAADRGYNAVMSEDMSLDSRIIRLLDANFNRAREALRVLEDAARFLLDDPQLSAVAKNLRHRLGAAVLSLPSAGRFSLERDTPGDVGTSLTAAGEQQRSTAIDVVNAAFGRLSEALRTLEEYSKILASRAPSPDSRLPTPDSLFKQLRYDTYTLHAALIRRLNPKSALSRLRLCVVITEEFCRGPWLPVAEQAIAGGANCLILHEPHLNDSALLQRSKAMAALCHRYDALFLMHGRPDIAALAGADGLHLDQADLPLAAARRILGPEAIVGLSVHTREQILLASGESPDYIAVGPAFSPTSGSQIQAADVELVRQVGSQVRIPLIATGDITPGNIADLLAAGAQAVAVCQTVISQPDVKAAAAALVAPMQ